MNPTEKAILISLGVSAAVLIAYNLYLKKKYGNLLSAASTTDSILGDIEHPIDFLERMFGHAAASGNYVFAGPGDLGN